MPSDDAGWGGAGEQDLRTRSGRTHLMAYGPVQFLQGHRQSAPLVPSRGPGMRACICPAKPFNAGAEQEQEQVVGCVGVGSIQDRTYECMSVKYVWCLNSCS